MKIEVNHQFKFAYIWLTNDEGSDEKIRVELQPLIDEYKEKKYKFVIYFSGKQELLELTKSLLKHNKNLVCNIQEDR